VSSTRAVNAALSEQVDRSTRNPQRRRVFRILSILSVCELLSAHSPYGQWTLYRKLHLIILTSRADEHNWKTGEALAKLLATYMPTSRATFARAREFTDIVHLLNSKQHDMALVRDIDAKEGLDGSGRFAEDGPTPLRSIARVGEYVLVTREDFERSHAYLIAQMIDHKWNELNAFVGTHRRPVPEANAPVPIHAGAAEYYADPVAPAPIDTAPVNPLTPSENRR
jgi:TRAP-type uncharacterized transport system substrate-binding protein